MDTQFTLGNKHRFAIPKERENILSKYTLADQIADLQQIEIYINKISIKTNRRGDEIRSYCYRCAEMILMESPTIEGLTSRMGNGGIRQFYQKVIAANIRIIWKLQCDEKLEERSKIKDPYDLIDAQRNTPLPDFPKEEL